MKHLYSLKIASAIFIFVSAKQWASCVLIGQTTSYIIAQHSGSIKNVSFRYEGVISKFFSNGMHEMDTTYGKQINNASNHQ